ncbi:hypothetical protein LRAMOSA00960 [Lichtheimia ramosa]|uniref:Uncharacterized protein n=1 Tax=Lichtheimia ramosa TaxID=688394 RepID=A0A077WBR6_9FUNG|nr:hypothetical protein LRAMOSA00960 [Lichtheimia ramosa]
MDKRAIEEYTKLEKEKNLSKIRLKRMAYEAMNEEAEKEEVTRRSTRIMNAKRKKTVPNFNGHDSISLPQVNGTLGSNLLQIGYETAVIDQKTRYFSCISKNQIVDLSNFRDGSQMKQLHISPTSKILNKISSKMVKVPEVELDMYFNSKKITNSTAAKQACDKLQVLHPKNDRERSLKKIILHVLEQHGYQSYMLSDKYIHKCTEQSLIIKFWGPIFESYFGYSMDTFIQWGDSLSKHTDKACSTIRLDLRIVIQNDGGDIESMAGEFASATAATGSKYYTDKTKIVLISKVHLNQVLSALNIPSKEDVVSIRIPMIQIMGMNCNIYSLSLVDKRTYRVEDVCDFIYPTTLRQIKNGTLATMINSMEMLKLMIEELHAHISNFSCDTSNKVTRFTKGKKPDKSVNIEEWISDLIPINDSDSEEESSEEI